MPNPEVLSHVFLGFTQNGQHLLSYNITSGSLNLYIWKFSLNSPLILISTKVLFTQVENGLGNEIQLVDMLYESIALFVYQWPGDDNHLLVFIIPDHPLASVVSVTGIHISKSSCYILEPGQITYSVVGWGHRHKFFDFGTKNGLDELLSPGLVLFSSSTCTFHTGTEVICLQIVKSDECTSNEESLNYINSKVLDVEKVLDDALGSNTGDDYVRLTTYELQVCGIEHKPATVNAFVHAVITRKNFPYYKEFNLNWLIDKDNYTIDHICDEFEKENVQAKDAFNTKRKVPVVSLMMLKELVTSQKESPIYSLNNMQFVECQLSLDQLDSPVDCISISLAHSCKLTR